MINRDFLFQVEDSPINVTVTPVNETIPLQYQEDFRFVWREKLGSKLRFQGDDYTYFKAKEAAGVCQMNFYVYMNCGGTFEYFAGGVIYPMRGEYNESKCFVPFDLEILDKYTCLLKRGKEKINVLLNTTPTEMHVVDPLSTVETCVCTYGGPPLSPFPTLTFYANCWPIPPAGNFILSPTDLTTGWTCTYHSQSNDVPGNNVIIETHWAREKQNSVPSPRGWGWVLIGGFWYRNIVTQILRDEEDGITTYYQAAPISQPIDNGRTLQLVLERLSVDLCPDIQQVVSNFYNINPQAGFPVSNTAYTYAEFYAANILFFQKSDITRAYTSGNAFLGEITFLDLMANLRDMHNVFWRLENIGGLTTLRVEHVSYFDSQLGQDLTTATFLKWHKGNKSYQREKTKYPVKETFATADNVTNFFRPISITWANGCEDPDTEINFNTPLFTTDFSGMVLNEYAQHTGFFLAACFPIAPGFTESVIIRQDGYVNTPLSWFRLVPQFFVYDRPQSSGASIPPEYTGADQPITIQTVSRKRKQAEIKVPMCCTDFYDFDPAKQVKTELGWGVVESANFDLKKKLMSLSVIHPD